MRVLALLCCVVVLTNCDEKSPVGPTVPLNQRVTLARGETVTTDGSSVRLQFVNVTGESRCPSDVVCIQAGDAVVHIHSIDGDGVADYELHAGDPGRAAETERGLRVQLVDLQPYPVSTKPIAPDDYRATVVVTRP
jgi:hypothetical protein